MRARYIAIPTAGPSARVLPFVGVLGLVAIWLLIAELELVKAAWVPHPWATAKAFYKLFDDGTYLKDGWPSLRRVLKAVMWSSIIGIPIGVAMGAFGKVESVLKWVIFPLRTAPIIAFVPIFFIIWGIEEEMKVWFLFFGTVVYIIPLTFDAVRAVPSEYIDAAVDYGFTPFGTLRHFIIPAAWPRIFEAIKVCTGIAWTYLVAAEIINVTTGLGASLYHAQRFQNTPRVWANILLILVIGNVTDYLLGQIRERFFNWEA